MPTGCTCGDGNSLKRAVGVASSIAIALRFHHVELGIRVVDRLSRSSEPVKTTETLCSRAAEDVVEDGCVARHSRRDDPWLDELAGDAGREQQGWMSRLPKLSGSRLVDGYALLFAIYRTRDHAQRIFVHRERAHPHAQSERNGDPGQQGHCAPDYPWRQCAGESSASAT